MRTKLLKSKQLWTIAALVAAFCAGTWSTSNPAHAQHRWTHCASLTIPSSSNGATLGGRQPQYPIVIPQGWAPVGGGMYKPGKPVVILCR